MEDGERESDPPPDATIATQIIVHSLMCHRQGGESEEFCKKAIESLLRKLLGKNEELDSLMTAVAFSGSQPSKCVTVPKSLDGRIQIAGRKGFPHVIYARIWRWPSAHRNELRSLQECEFGYGKIGCDCICVNPYHYERINTLRYVLPSGGSDTKLSTALYPGPASSSSVTEYAQVAGPSWMVPHRSGMSLPPSGLTTTSEPSSQDAGGQGLKDPATNSGTGMHSGIWQMDEASGSYQGMVEGGSGSMGVGGGGGVEPQSARAEETKLHLGPSGGDPNDALNFTRSIPSYAVADVQTDTGYYLQQQQQQTYQGTSAGSGGVPLLSTQRPPEYWCSIAYFELDAQVGDTFKGRSTYPRITVDGFLDPIGGNRFCLGALTNVHRAEQSERTRIHIGYGVQLELQGEGDVELLCLSPNSVFIESYYLDRESGLAPGTGVHKVYPNVGIKVFDLQKCYYEMQQQAANAQSAAATQAAAIAGNVSVPPGDAISAAAAVGIGVDDLRRWCSFKLSFVKGWGENYHRKTIKETPCWIEVHIHRALQLLDAVLHAMPIAGAGVEN